MDYPVVSVPASVMWNNKEALLTEKHLTQIELMMDPCTNFVLAGRAHCSETKVGHMFNEMYLLTSCIISDRLSLFLFTEKYELIKKVNGVWIANWQHTPYLIPKADQRAAYHRMKKIIG